MENKNAVLIFTVLLAFATLYTLSFNWASKRFEAKASIHGQYIADSLQENNLLGSLTLEEAENFKKEIIEKGIGGSFVIALHNDELIPVTKAKEIIEEE